MSSYGCVERYVVWRNSNTVWPRKNATTLIVNFKNIINKTELIFVSLCGEKKIPTKLDHDHQFWVRCLDLSAILVRQCHFQNVVLFRPHRTLEHSKIPTSRRPVRRQSPCFEKEDNVNKRSYSLRNS